MHKLSDKEYLEKLKQQREFLRSELQEYERGKPDFTIKMAATIRTIFHSTQASTPILPDLAERNGCRITFRGKDQSGIDEYVVLYLGFQVGKKKPLFDAPSFLDKSFEDYWNEVVYKEGKIRYTRKQIVLWAANKLGGAHVDPEIPPGLFHLVNGGPRLVSKSYGEETIINQVVYEMALQVLDLLDRTIPMLEKKIA
jgi:hypothetical protein